MFYHRTHDQNTKFRKFKMTVGRHFENGFIANHPISVQPQVTLPRTVTWQSATILQIQHGRQPP